MLTSMNPESSKTTFGCAKNMSFTVLAVCVLSAPGNELRGYCVGAIITAIALGIGTLATPQAEQLWGAMMDLKELDPDRIKHFLQTTLSTNGKA